MLRFHARKPGGPHGWLVLLLTGLAVACSGGQQAQPDLCTPGHQAACACEDGRAGSQRCADNGSYGACVCMDGTGSSRAPSSSGSSSGTSWGQVGSSSYLAGSVGSSASLPTSSASSSSSSGGSSSVATSGSGGPVTSSSSRLPGQVLGDFTVTYAYPGGGETGVGQVAVSRDKVLLAIEARQDGQVLKAMLFTMGSTAPGQAVLRSGVVGDIVPTPTGFLYAGWSGGAANTMTVGSVSRDGAVTTLGIPQAWGVQRALSSTSTVISNDEGTARLTAAGAIRLAPQATALSQQRDGVVAAAYVTGTASAGTIEVHRISETSTSVLSVMRPNVYGDLWRLDHAGDLTLVNFSGGASHNDQEVRLYRGATLVASASLDDLEAARLVGDGTEDVILVTQSGPNGFRVRRVHRDLETPVWGDLVAVDGETFAEFTTVGRGLAGEVAVVFHNYNGGDASSYVRVLVYAP